MSQRRGTTTDRLSNVIEVIQLGRRTGFLTVERGEGQTLEEGFLVFVNGRVVDARTGQHTSWAAFNYLKTWGSCRFSFESGAAGVPMSPSPSMNGNGHVSGRLNGSRPLTGPVSGEPISGPLAPSSGPLGRFPMRTQAGEAALLRSDSTGLPRTHRRLLLLVNGQRSYDDLARLMARNPDEVRILLDELEQAGFIQS